MSGSCISGRLVVTGQAADGSAVITADSLVPAIALVEPTVRAHFLWGRDDVATFPDAGASPAVTAGVPPPGGCRFSSLTVSAGATRDYHAFVARALGDLAEPAQPGFHTTPTLDFIVVLDGELVLEVDHGEERTLRRGDSAVLNGVRHRWHNRGTEDATLVAVMLGARMVTGPSSLNGDPV